MDGFSGDRIPLVQDESISDNPELDYEAGIDTGEQQALEGLEDRLIDELDLDPEDVEEFLYDPAARRHRRRHHRSRSRSHMRHVFDPAPRRGRSRSRSSYPGKGRHSRKNKILSKLKPWVLPAAAGVTFYAAYTKRASELFTGGKITKNDVFEAISYDIKNFNSTDAMNRLKAQAGSILIPSVGGLLLKETKILGPWSNIAGDLLTGFGIGTAGKAILDPPIDNTGPATKKIQVLKAEDAAPGVKAPCPGCQKQYSTYNPATGGI